MICIWLNLPAICMYTVFMLIFVFRYCLYVIQISSHFRGSNNRIKSFCKNAISHPSVSWVNNYGDYVSSVKLFSSVSKILYLCNSEAQSLKLSPQKTVERCVRVWLYGSRAEIWLDIGILQLRQDLDDVVTTFCQSKNPTVVNHL